MIVHKGSSSAELVGVEVTSNLFNVREIKSIINLLVNNIDTLLKIFLCYKCYCTTKSEKITATNVTFVRLRSKILIHHECAHKYIRVYCERPNIEIKTFRLWK